MQKTGAVPGGAGVTETTIPGGPTTDQPSPGELRAAGRPEERGERETAPTSSTTDQPAGDAVNLLPPPRSEADRFVEELRHFAADIETLLRRARTVSGHGALAARAGLERRVAQARTGLASTREVTVDRMHDLRDRTERYVRHDPWTAVGIAAAVGFAIGLLSGRRGR